MSPWGANSSARAVSRRFRLETQITTMSRRSLALLAAVLVLALGVGWFALRASSVGRSTGSMAAADRGIATASEQVELVEPTPREKGAQSSSATRVSAQPMDAAAAVLDELTESRWVEGRVEFPPGTPSDEHAFVLVHATLDSPRRVEIAADGRFRVEFEPRRPQAHLEVRGRYLYSSSARQVDARNPPDHFVLRPSLGSLMRVQLLPSAQALASGVNLARARVIARPLEIVGLKPGSPTEMTLPLQRQGITDANGFVELCGLRSGLTWRVSVEMQGFTPPPSDARKSKPGVVLDVDVPLFVAPIVGGVVRDEHGTPIEGALVTFVIGDVEGADRSWASRTESDGRFRREIEQIGSLTLKAEHAQYLPRVLGPWELSEGASYQNIDVVLGAGRAITGIVRLTDGTPVSDTYIRASSLSELEQDPARSLSTNSGLDGTFRLSGLGNQAYAVHAKKLLPPDPHSKSKVGRVRWTARLDRVDAGTQGVVLVLDSGSKVRGRVVDDRGAPVTRASLSLRACDSSDPARLSSTQRLAGSERFEFEAVPDGSWWIKITALPGTASTSIALDLPRDSGRELEIVIARPATIQGRIVDSRGVPLRNAIVQLERLDDDDKEGWGFPGASTDAQGRFEFARITATKYRLMAANFDGGPSPEVLITLAPGETRSNIELRVE